MMITVFTPTYNRGYIISNLYDSLKRQTVKTFEWIVIDDGSTDHTEKLFQNFLKEKNDFSITYKKVPNGGKHRAINKGVSLAKGDLFFIVDSVTGEKIPGIDLIARVLQRRVIAVGQDHVALGLEALQIVDDLAVEKL